MGLMRTDHAGDDPAEPQADRRAEGAVTRRTLLAGAAAATAGAAAGGPAGRAAAAAIRGIARPSGAADRHTVIFDKYSLMVDGNRLAVWSGEFHPFRLLSPSLWRDILQKMKASGYNAVCVYFNCGSATATPA